MEENVSVATDMVDMVNACFSVKNHVQEIREWLVEIIGETLFIGPRDYQV